MQNKNNPWAIYAAVILSVITVKIGVHNLEWGLKKTADIVNHYRVV